MIPAFEHGLVEEVGSLHFAAEEFAALYREACLGKGDAAALGGYGCEPRFGLLVVVAARGGAAEVHDAAHFLVVGAEEGERHAVLALGELVGVALGAYKDKSHGFVPQPSDAAPRGCHHVEMLGRAGGYQHPFLANELEGIFGSKGFEVSFLHSRLLF